jgi:hypothetical protein
MIIAEAFRPSLVACCENVFFLIQANHIKKVWLTHHHPLVRFNPWRVYNADERVAPPTKSTRIIRSRMVAYERTGVVL